MRKQLNIVWLLCAAVFALTTIQADALQPPEETREDKIGRILDLSGLDVQIPQIADMIMVQFDALIKQIPEELRGKASDVITLSFDGDTMLEIVKNEVSQKVSLNEADKLLEWYTSETASEITRVEETAVEAADYQEMLTRKKELFADKARVELCKKIDKAAHVTEAAVQMQMDMMRSMIKLTQKDMPKEKVEELLEQQKAQMEEGMREMQILSMLYAYQGLEEKKLRAYIDFLSKSTTQSLITSANMGISKAMLDGTDKMIKGFMGLRK